MKQFSAETDIQGTADQVWAVLTNAAAYPDWDPNMESIEGSIGPNEKLVLHTTLSKRAFKITVTEFVPGSRMVWSSGMPLGLFSGKRTFEITPGNGSVRFRLNEVFSGLLSPLFGRMIPDLNPSFLKFVQGLKAEVEGGSSSDSTESSE